MKNNLNIIAFVFIFALPLWGRVNIPLNDHRISYDGIWFEQASAEKVIFNRHTEAFLSNPECGVSIYSKPYAYTQTGVKIRFKTKSKSIRLAFENRPNSGNAGLHNAFLVYANGKRHKIYETLTFTISSPASTTEAVLYEVLLPSMYGVNLISLSLDDGYELEEIPPLNKPVLAVIGTSISHGTGQQSASFSTYPYIIAENMNWELVNLAVAGAYTGWPAGQLVSGQKVDYIIVELGFNDWMWDNKPLSEKEVQYIRLLDTLRSNQKNAKIFCITPITTTESVSKSGAGFSLNDFREMVKNTVSERRNKGDENIFLIHGENMTTASMLDDGVHLNVKGAEIFGGKMTNQVKKKVSSKK